jgi:hypothetical protein
MEYEYGWAHRTQNLSGLSYRFAVRADDELLGRLADAVLAGLRDPCDAAPIEHWYSLTASDAALGTVDVTCDDGELARGQHPGDALGWVVRDVNRAAAEASGCHLLLHAGGVEAGGTGVLIPGASGSGKSTLVAGLVRSGLGYLTDELAALDMASGKLMPYPKPITVKSGSFAVLSDMGPDVCRGPGHGPWAGEEWQLAVGEGTGRRVGGPCEAGVVVVPRYDATAETALTPLSATQAFLALAVNAVNLIPHGSAGTRALGRLAVRCRCFSLTVSDLDAACRLVLGLVEAPAARGGAGREP